MCVGNVPKGVVAPAGVTCQPFGSLTFAAACVLLPVRATITSAIETLTAAKRRRREEITGRILERATSAAFKAGCVSVELAGTPRTIWHTASSSWAEASAA